MPNEAVFIGNSCLRLVLQPLSSGLGTGRFGGPPRRTPRARPTRIGGRMTYSRDAETLGKLAGDREAPTPVTLAEWVNAGRCPRRPCTRPGGWSSI